MIDILDQLQSVNGYVRVTLKNGEVIYGKPDCIVYDDTDETVEKMIRFEPYRSADARYFNIKEMASFDTCRESEIPRS